MLMPGTKWQLVSALSPIFVHKIVKTTTCSSHMLRVHMPLVLDTNCCMCSLHVEICMLDISTAHVHMSAVHAYHQREDKEATAAFQDQTATVYDPP